MSTVKVYGEESDTIYKEDTPCHPQDEYGKSKLEAEKALTKLESDSFKVAIIRTPIVYGKGVKANILNLVKLIEKMPILPLANIQNRRSMVYIANLSAIINQIIIKKKSGIFLASDDRIISTTELVQLIAMALNKNIFLFSIPLFPVLLKKFKPSFYKRLYKSLEVDNTFTKKTLNFSNIYSVEEGIRQMINKEK
jgi:UDP-glucose 4-epimerase